MSQEHIDSVYSQEKGPYALGKPICAIMATSVWTEAKCSQSRRSPSSHCQRCPSSHRKNILLEKQQSSEEEQKKLTDCEYCPGTVATTEFEGTPVCEECFELFGKVAKQRNQHQEAQNLKKPETPEEPEETAVSSFHDVVLFQEETPTQEDAGEPKTKTSARKVYLAPASVCSDTECKYCRRTTVALPKKQTCGRCYSYERKGFYPPPLLEGSRKRYKDHELVPLPNGRKDGVTEAPKQTLTCPKCGEESSVFKDNVCLECASAEEKTPKSIEDTKDAAVETQDTPSIPMLNQFPEEFHELLKPTEAYVEVCVSFSKSEADKALLLRILELAKKERRSPDQQILMMLEQAAAT